MDTLLLLILALLPGFLLLYFILFMDRKEKEPLAPVTKIMALGALSVVPVAMVEHFLALLPIYGGGNFASALTTAFIQVAWVEELAKLGVVLLFAWHNKNFNEENDGIVYVGASALGFAMLENIFYVLDRGIAVGLMRSITAIPLHCFSGVIMGYYVGLAKFAPPGKKVRQNIIKGFILAFVLHGVYDALVLTRTPAALLIFPLVTGMVIFGVRIMKKSRARSSARVPETDAEVETLAQQKVFAQSNPKRQQWKIIISRTLFVVCGLFWAALVTVLMAGAEQVKTQVFETILAGIIFTFLPILIAVILEISYRQRRAYYEDTRERFVNIPETVAGEPLPPPGYLWQIVTARIMQILSALFWTFLVLGLLIKTEEKISQGAEVLFGGIIISFIPIFLSVALELTYRRKKRIYNERLQAEPDKKITQADLRLSPPGHLWKIILSGFFLTGSALFCLLFVFEALSGSQKVVSKWSDDLAALLLIAAIPISAGITLALSYRKAKKAFRQAQTATPKIPRAFDPRMPAESDEELRDYSKKLKDDRNRDRFYYKKRE
jgi:RsiW-degrading membrane proteinase PrsW (M82 family)